MFTYIINKHVFLISSFLSSRQLLLYIIRSRKKKKKVKIISMLYAFPSFGLGLKTVSFLIYLVL